MAPFIASRVAVVLVVGRVSDCSSSISISIRASCRFEGVDPSLPVRDVGIDGRDKVEALAIRKTSGKRLKVRSTHKLGEPKFSPEEWKLVPHVHPLCYWKPQDLLLVHLVPELLANHFGDANTRGCGPRCVEYIRSVQYCVYQVRPVLKDTKAKGLWVG